MSDLPQVKGTGMLPAVAALRALSPSPDDLPRELRPYLELEVDSLDWYPFEHMLGILSFVGEQLLPDTDPDARFRYFGHVAAQRDLEGKQDLVVAAARTEHAGVYVGAVRANMPPLEQLKRSFSLFELYFERGQFEVAIPEAHRVEATLVGFPAVDGLCQICLGYLEHTLKIVGVGASVEKPACALRGDPHCVFAFTLPEPLSLGDPKA